MRGNATGGTIVQDRTVAPIEGMSASRSSYIKVSGAIWGKRCAIWHLTKVRSINAACRSNEAANGASSVDWIW